MTSVECKNNDPAAELVVLLLARGFAEAHSASQAEGSVLRQDAAMPDTLRRASALVSRLCIVSGTSDLGASVHVLSALACSPMRSWGIPAFLAPWRFAEAVLIEGETGTPTDDCREMARMAGGGEVVLQETLHHEMLRAVVARRPPRERDKAYSEIRGFVVRNPAVQAADLIRFAASGGHATALQVLQSFYRPVPQTALFGASARRCGGCGSLLWPSAGADPRNGGECRIRRCRMANPAAPPGETIDDPASWRVATPAVAAYWVGPGLDEIRIFDALAAAGRDARLYPLQDAADVGVDSLDTGIDVKAYASAAVLGARLSRDMGRLGIFRRRILAVPDDKLTSNPHYLDQLRGSFRGADAPEFMTVSQAIRSLVP